MPEHEARVLVAQLTESEKQALLALLRMIKSERKAAEQA